MRQTSLSTWLRKPPTVSEPPPTSALPRVPQDDPAIPLEPLPKPGNSEEESDSLKNEAGDIPDRLTGSLVLKPSQRLPETASLVPLTRDLLQQYKRLNSLLLPIPYSNTTYEETITDPLISRLSFAVLWHDPPKSRNTSTTPSKPRMVGAIRCKLLPGSPPSSTPQTPQDLILYISTIGVLSPFRHHGLATHLLDAALRAAVALPSSLVERKQRVAAIRAHVWEANEEGLAWYAKRGFKVVGREEGYYQRLRPKGAVVVRRGVGPGDLVRGVGGREKVEGRECGC